MDEERRVMMASLYLEGEADVWYRDYQEGREMISWDVFSRDITSMFQELGHDDVVGEFNKLSQVGNAVEYQVLFEELNALMITKKRYLTEEYFTSSFISGLDKDLRIGVQMFSPTSLQQAIHLAKM